MSEDTGQDLRRATILGARWMSAARLVMGMAAFGSVVALARLIPPAEFGSAAVALVFVGVAAILGPLGLTAVLVQRPALTRREIESAAFLCLSLGGTFAAATFVFATTGAAERLFGQRTADLLALSSPAFLLVGVGGVPQALVQRELRFARVALMDAFPAVLGAVTAVSLAVAGVEGESILAGALVVVGSVALFALVSVPPVTPRPSRAGIRELIGFATPATLSSLVYLGFRHIDYVILGARMAPEQVGFYWRAYQLGVEYQGKISQVMQRVSFPVYSRAADVDELKRLRFRIVRTHATVIVPLLAGFIAVAPTLIPSLFGDAWQPAVVPAQIMAVAGMAEAVTTGVGPLVVALGRPGLLLAWNVVEFAVFATVIALLAPHGLTWVATGVAVYTVASMLATQCLLMPRVIGLGLADFWRDVRAGVVTAAVVLPSLVGSRMVLERLSVPTLPKLALLAVVGAAVSAVVLRLLFAKVWIDLLRLLRRVLVRERQVTDEASGV